MLNLLVMPYYKIPFVYIATDVDEKADYREYCEKRGMEIIGEFSTLEEADKECSKLLNERWEKMLK